MGKDSITFQPSDADRKAVSRLLCKYRPRVRRQSAIHLAFTLIALTLLAVYFYNLRITSQFFADVCFAYGEYDENSIAACEADSSIARDHLSWLIYSLLAQLLLIASWLTYSYRSNWRNTFHSLNGRTFTYTISPNGLGSHEHGKARTHYPWHAIERMAFDKGYILFFIDRCVALFVSEKHFATAQDAKQFHQQAQEWWREANTAPSASQMNTPS